MNTKINNNSQIGNFLLVLIYIENYIIKKLYSSQIKYLHLDELLNEVYYFYVNIRLWNLQKTLENRITSELMVKCCISLMRTAENWKFSSAKKYEMPAGPTKVVCWLL